MKIFRLQISQMLLEFGTSITISIVYRTLALFPETFHFPLLSAMLSTSSYKPSGIYQLLLKILINREDNPCIRTWEFSQSPNQISWTCGAFFSLTWSHAMISMWVRSYFRYVVVNFFAKPTYWKNLSLGVVWGAYL